MLYGWQRDVVLKGTNGSNILHLENTYGRGWSLHPDARWVGPWRGGDTAG